MILADFHSYRKYKTLKQHCLEATRAPRDHTSRPPARTSVRSLSAGGLVQRAHFLAELLKLLFIVRPGPTPARVWLLEHGMSPFRNFLMTRQSDETYCILAYVLLGVDANFPKRGCEVGKIMNIRRPRVHGGSTMSLFYENKCTVILDSTQ